MSDPKSNATQYSYADAFQVCGSAPGNTDAYLTKITDAKGFTQSFTYRYCDGQLNSSTDRNTQPTSYAYADLLNRLTGISYPGTGSSTYGYGSDACGTPSTTSILISGSSYYTETATLDGVCHVTETALTSDPAGADYTDTPPDGLGRDWKVSNPYRSGGDQWTTTTYDPLGRVTLVTYPDGGTASTSYSSSGNTYCSTFTDPAGKPRTPCSNALGQILKVTEAGPYTTTYSYDRFDFYVTQGSSQTRTFTYDSLSRLVSATNPESGTTTYTYPTSNTGPCSGDPSDVCTRTDARGITTTYAYVDALNRLTSKTYSDGTPTATFAYDLTSVWGESTDQRLGASGACANHQRFDIARRRGFRGLRPMGRVQVYRQCTPQNCGTSDWRTTYNYDSAGDVTTWIHPAGFTITQTINGAREVSQVASSWSDETHPPVLAENMSYTPWGALSSLQNGCVGSGCTNVQETYAYNNRLQPTQIQLGTSGNAGAYYTLAYNYSLPGGTTPPGCPVSTSGSGNNGDVIGYTYTDADDSTMSHSALYVYDGVNRLACAQATGNITYNLAFSYTQDGSNGQYGNMSCVINGYTQGVCAHNNFTAANNHVSGYTYDAAGNLSSDGTNSFSWDAEGRETNSSAVYNAFGQEVYYAVPWTNMSVSFDLNGDWLGTADGGGLWVDQIRAGGRKIAAYSRDNNETYHSTPTFLLPQPKTPIIWGTGPRTYGGIPGVSCGKRPVVHGSTSGGISDGDGDFKTAPHRTYDDLAGRWLTPTRQEWPLPTPATPSPGTCTPMLPTIPLR